MDGCRVVGSVCRLHPFSGSDQGQAGVQGHSVSQITTRIDLDPCRRCAELWWFVWLQRGNSLAAGQLHTKLFSDKGKGPPALGSLAEGDDDSYAPRQQHSRSREETLSSTASFCPPCRD